MQHDVTIDAQTTLKLVDYATLRARGGYAIGQFLPYMVVGAALGVSTIRPLYLSAIF